MHAFNKQFLYKIIFALCVVLLCAFHPYVKAETNTDYSSLAPGELIDIGGYNLHLYCEGSNYPAVIIDSGVGGFSLEWFYLQKKLSIKNKVCVYDRAGYGWSDFGPLPRTTKRITNELRKLLEIAKIPPPYVFIGHSFGGYTAQYFARNYKDEVAGLLLIDSSHPDQSNRMESASDKQSVATTSTTDSYRVIQPVIPENFPQEHLETARYIMSSWKTVMTQREEIASMPVSGQQITISDTMSNIPLTILTRSQRSTSSDNLSNSREDIWLQLQKELAAMSQNATHQIVENSGHHIHLDQPEVVIAAIENLIKTINHNKALVLVECGKESGKKTDNC